MDLMFGADYTDPDDFSAREFRLKELLRAQKLSAGPYFVVSDLQQISGHTSLLLLHDCGRFLRGNSHFIIYCHQHLTNANQVLLIL